MIPTFDPSPGHVVPFLRRSEDEIPSLDIYGFVDYLFCINSLLEPTNFGDMAWMDKCPFQEKLLEHLFNNLLTHVDEKNISINSAADILELTWKIATKDGRDLLRIHVPAVQLRPAIYHFCEAFPQGDDELRDVAGWFYTVIQASCFIKPWDPRDSVCDGDSTWI
ncbi:hypothetical protein DFH06DRAFT_1178676, partial [Mycena polygramma]